MKTYTFHVQGMHCKACVALTENELCELPQVKNAKASLAKLNVEVTGDFKNQSAQAVAEELSKTLKPHGYTLTLEAQKPEKKWSDFKLALPLALVFVMLFVFLQKAGIINLINTDSVSYGSAFAIGLVASVSSCMAVVGGLVLSMSANLAKEQNLIRPQIYFHISRLISFFLLGGIIGAIGAVFQLGQTGTFVLSLLIAIVLLILGLNLLEVFPWAKKIQPTLPTFIGKRINNIKKINHALTPLLLGTATFFLPCGFTQSMQIYTLTIGNFLSGALIMFAFALGTLPVLALLSFSSNAILKKTWSSTFFKTVGLIIIFFGIFNLLNAFATAGIINPLFSF